ncbi:hypothetical protein HKX54_02360 [Sulfitobacter sp. M57]|nr:hypothetical protein [Sulfitobacter sp. KE5]MDF3421434.1 hypothetical protein [Sulfitobacter sp. KE43]MDF3431833.1 hypothetical protein [Sulfitobacter sp. KE42]MDF3457473.1 hypothetical protein [Sulfitobacter sp. S74]MDF3461375.1 hypothetical protein [Sulfitobacter sp. Ks18]MDF3465275.1 hypothetical protein [Sulfitobacter sp. M05]MDF3469171.1 hypothetical protein [Sulfitobacter sp. M28]MDF3472915.1 hypothetical protein [Sulfitobacter sp. M48]MDF3476822.1 hypothetical protein [Sulfitobact
MAWGSLGKGASLPRAAIYRVSGQRDMHMGGKGLMQARLQIDCYGEDYPQALDASKAISGLLEGYRGGPVQGVFLKAIRDGIEGDTSILQRVSLTFSVTYRD